MSFFLLPIPRRLTRSDTDITRPLPRALGQECIDAYHKIYLLGSEFACKPLIERDACPTFFPRSTQVYHFRQPQPPIRPVQNPDSPRRTNLSSRRSKRDGHPSEHFQAQKETETSRPGCKERSSCSRPTWRNHQEACVASLLALGSIWRCLKSLKHIALQLGELPCHSPVPLRTAPKTRSSQPFIRSARHASSALSLTGPCSVRSILHRIANPM